MMLSLSLTSCSCLRLLARDLFFLVVSIDSWIAAGAILPLTIAFFVLIVFVATQDIAVDGWAITLLSKRNVGYASTCQSIGQNLGFFASYTVFLALAEPRFCNKFRSEPNDAEGFVTISGYMFFWGVAFILCTLYLFLFKHEPAYVPEPDEDMRVGSLYARMWRVLQLARQNNTPHNLGQRKVRGFFSPSPFSAAHFVYSLLHVYLSPCSFSCSSSRAGDADLSCGVRMRGQHHGAQGVTHCTQQRSNATRCNSGLQKSGRAETRQQQGQHESSFVRSFLRSVVLRWVRVCVCVFSCSNVASPKRTWR